MSKKLNLCTCHKKRMWLVWIVLCIEVQHGKYFGIHKKALNSTWVVCLKCYKWISRHDNNTNNMRYHLKSAHGIDLSSEGKE